MEKFPYSRKNNSSHSIPLVSRENYVSTRLENVTSFMILFPIFSAGPCWAGNRAVPCRTRCASTGRRWSGSGSCTWRSRATWSSTRCARSTSRTWSLRFWTLNLFERRWTKIYEVLTSPPEEEEDEKVGENIFLKWERLERFLCTNDWDSYPTHITKVQ